MGKALSWSNLIVDGRNWMSDTCCRCGKVVLLLLFFGVVCCCVCVDDFGNNSVVVDIDVDSPLLDGPQLEKTPRSSPLQE